jgi:hypothetical protein
MRKKKEKPKSTTESFPEKSPIDKCLILEGDESNVEVLIGDSNLIAFNFVI